MLKKTQGITWEYMEDFIESLEKCLVPKSKNSPGNVEISMYISNIYPVRGFKSFMKWHPHRITQ